MVVVCLLFAGCTGKPSEVSPRTGPPSSAASPITSTQVSADPATGLSVLGRVGELSGHATDGTWFDSRELDGCVWIAILLPESGVPGPLVAALAKLSTAVEKLPEQREIHLVCFRQSPPANSPPQPPFSPSAAWKIVTLATDQVSVWSKTALGESAAENAETSGDSPPCLVLVDATGRVRGRDYSPTPEGLPLLVDDLRRTFAERKAVPPEIVNPPWFASRREAQLVAAKDYSAQHDFQFTDRRIESGIRFRNKIVDDAGKFYKAGHYDHGNGVAIADADLDGREDIYFVNQVGGNELWRNLGGGKFENITSASGVALADRIGVSASFADIDNDGDPDLYVTTTRGGNALFENDGTGHFRDISVASGTNYVGHSSAAVFFDFNRDGLLDLFVVNVGRFTSDERKRVTMEPLRDELQGEYFYYDAYKDAFAGHLKPERAERSILYQNLGGNVFRDVTEVMGLVDESWSGDASPLDVNSDGWPDLYLVNMQGNDEYYENVKGQSFVCKSREVFPKTPWGSMGIKSFDFDNDGDLDLFVTDMHSDMSSHIGPEREQLKSDMKFPDSFLQTQGQSLYGNAFFRNAGNGKFEEVSDSVGAENYWPWGLSVGDLNADGFQDVFIASSMNLPFRYGVNSVLLNDRGRKFLGSEFVLGVEPRRGGRTAIPWYEVGCGGADAGHLDCQGRSGRVVVWAALGSRSSVIFDLDQDGDLDIVTNDFNSEPLVLVSNFAERHPKLQYLKVRLRGTASSRQGLGAVVRVKAGKQVWTQVHDGKSGYLSQSADLLYFGLGSITQLDELEIQWPSGRRQTVPGPLSLNVVLDVTENKE
ncbi:MAG: ypmQ 2 [Planctomycetaceae bacterium]|nr:ypmQ 2 [Planctomycetaceae bacterium]